MKEILFKGKRTDNGKWVQGNLLTYGNKAYIVADEDVTGFEDVILSHIYWKVIENRFEVDPATVGQYTGLTDKNGTKIFEGDIVQFSDGTKCEIKWGEYTHSKCDEYECEHYGWYVDFKRRNYVENTGYDLYDVAAYIEVIGNIYDNA